MNNNQVFSQRSCTTREKISFTFQQGLRMKVLIFCVALFPGQIALANGGDIVVRTGEKTTVATIAASQKIILPVTYDRSYCCEVLASDSSSQVKLQSVDFNFSEVLFQGAERGNTEPRIAERDGRRCFVIRRAAGNNSGSGSELTFNLGFTSGSSANDVSINCQETTLFCGFNTFASEVNVLEVSNTQTSDPSTPGFASVTAYTSMNITSRVPVERRDLSPLFVQASSRVDSLSITSLAGPSAFGTLAIAHDGAPGSLRARVARYGTGAGAVSSSGLTPGDTELCQTRNQMQ